MSRQHSKEREKRTTETSHIRTVDAGTDKRNEMSA